MRLSAGERGRSRGTRRNDATVRGGHDDPPAVQRRYDRWTWTISLLIVTTTAGTVPGLLSPGAGAIALGFAGVVLLSTLYTIAGDGHPLPNALTAVRGVAGAALLLWSASFLLSAAPGGGNDTAAAVSPDALWIVFSVLALVEVTDFFDGRTARRFGATPFGAVWDMENDAFFTFALSFTVWGFLGFPPFVLAIGLMRYLYFLAVRVQGDPPVHPKAYKLFAKSVAAILVVALIGAFVPVVPGAVRMAALAIALALQILSFGWDLLLHIRSRNSTERFLDGR